MEHNITTQNQIRTKSPNEQKKEGKIYEIENLLNNKKYKIILLKGENSIIFNVTEIGDIKGTLYKNEVSFNKFEKMDKYFRQFDNIEEIYLDLSRRKDNEIKVEEIENNIKLTLTYEIRNEQKDLPFILTQENLDINKIVMNLCEKSKEIDDLKKENEQLKHQIEELQRISKGNEINCIYEDDNPPKTHFGVTVITILNDYEAKFFPPTKDLIDFEKLFSKKSKLNLNLKPN